MIRLRAPTSRRHASFVTYAASFAATWGLLGLEAKVRVPEVAVAFALQVVVGVALSRGHRDRPHWVGVGGMIIFLVSVALLRDGVGPTAGYTSLMLLPVFWASLRSRRAELVLALAGAALLLFTPLVLIGGAHYPSSGWRTGALWIVIAAGLGTTVLSLVNQLRSSNQRHRLLADNSSGLVARFAPDGTISYVSPASSELLGYAPEELVGQPTSAFMHPEDAAGLAQHSARADATASTVVEEYRLRHGDGSWIWFEATIRTIRDPRGVVTEWQAALRMIEERKRLQMIVERQRDEATNLLAGQSALRQIATLVAAGAKPDAVFDAMAKQLAQLFDAMLGSVVRFDATADLGEYVGAWSATGTQLTGQTIDLAGATATAHVHQLGRFAQVIRYPDHSTDRFLDEFPLGGGFAAPISAGGRLWGAVGVALAAGRTVPADAQERLSSFAELAAMAISSTEAMETLSREAATDPLTGLANYRAFHERLGIEVERSSRHGRLLSVAVLDLDHFKQVNDTHGHLIGDRVLAEVAKRLANAVRTGELVARIGGEEFAWLMPEVAQADAYSAAERVRQAIKSTPFDAAGALTMSIGVCSNEHAGTTEDLLGFADQALYRAKQGGRNLTSVYGADRPPKDAEAAPGTHKQRLSVPMSNGL
jgi:diguanylate cyclase (GGDEF)-like protein/PAS domain S-box-containing protein